MVLPVSGFLPVPLPMMIPFMGAQSLVIGKMFGEGFQYGKRKISAMPNEEFNQLTFEKMMSNAREEIKASIPTMNAAMQDMSPMVEVVVREFFNYVSLVTKIVAGVGDGENIFQKEGHDIGDWIAQQLGIPHTPHQGGGGAIPMTPAGTPVPTVQKPGVRFERTLKQAQADTSRSRGTGIIGRGKKKAGQSQILERQKLMNLIKANLVRGFRPSANTLKARKAVIDRTRIKIAALEQRYRF